MTRQFHNVFEKKKNSNQRIFTFSLGHSTRSLKKTNCSIKKARKQHCFEKKDKSKSQPWVSFWPSSTRHLEKKELEIPEGDKEESLVETPSAGSVSPATLNEGGGNR